MKEDNETHTHTHAPAETCVCVCVLVSDAHVYDTVKKLTAELDESEKINKALR